MLYNRNKDAFKKTTIKVEHPQANRSLLNLINSKISQSNQSILSERPPPPPYSLPFEKISQNEPKFIKKKNYEKFNLHHIIDIQLKHEGKANKAKQQYIKILEQKIKEKEQNMLSSVNHDEIQRLYRFHQQARNIILSSCMELIECKSQISKESRIDSINLVLSKNQQFLQVQSSILSMKGETLQNAVNNNQLIQLRQVCAYQQKIINYLKQQNKQIISFNQIKLLRHQINRISQQNEKLRLKQNIIHPSFSFQDKQPLHLNEKIKQLNQLVQRLKDQLKIEQDKCYKLKQEKQYILNMLEEEQGSKQTQQGLKQTIRTQSQTIQSIRDDYMKLIEVNQNLKKRIDQRIYSENVSMPVGKLYDIIQSKFRNDPQLTSLLNNLVKKYEQKIQLLRQQVMKIKDEKDRVIKCSKNVILMLKNSNLNSQIVEQEILKFCNLSIQQNKIQKLLKQVLAFSIGIDKWEMTQMEQQLQQYVILLRSRNQAIKQVENEDGSSVHGSSISQTFTQDF